jgi:hypothetical protein
VGSSQKEDATVSFFHLQNVSSVNLLTSSHFSTPFLRPLVRIKKHGLSRSRKATYAYLA